MSNTQPKRPPHTNGYRGNGDYVSDEDDELMRAGAPKLKNGKMPRIDFSKLDAMSLQKYQQAYKLGKVDDHNLVHLVARHFAAQVVDEDETLLRFAIALRKNGKLLGGVNKGKGGRPRGR